MGHLFLLPADILYSIQVFTGNVSAASSDADVYIMISGEHGDTYKRKLRHPRSMLFQRHKVGIVFTVLL